VDAPSSARQIFQIVETPNNALTISQEGNSRSQMTFNGIHGGQASHLCGLLTFSSAGQKTIRVYYESLISVSLSANTIPANRQASAGQRDIHWTVRKWPK